jgi:riboflavin kinase/FMN adenylyltransferase
MRVYRDLSSLPVFNNAVITIGTFDGVHLGHRQIIAQLKEEAAKINGESVIITFHPHPRKIISSVPGDIKLLNTLEERIELLINTDIDHLVIVPFNHHFANQTAEQYIKDFLYHYFKPHTVIIGYDHHFGKGREGDYHLMDKYGEELGFIVKEIPEKLLNEVIISSTKIRQSLLESSIAVANEFLGYAYFFEGLIVEGNKLGRTLGYPTANLHIESEEKLIPGNGVYAVTVDRSWQIGDSDIYPNHQPTLVNLLKGMMNIGLRPTVDGKQRMIEVNIFDFAEDIYGQRIRIYLNRYIRGEIKFNGLDELKLQLFKDKVSALDILK